MKEVFDAYIENAFGEYKQAEFKFKQFEVNYLKHFPDEKNEPVLDIGIGRGEMLTCFKNWGYLNYLGIDISPSTVSFCKSIGLNCSLVEDTVKYLEDHKDTYIVITLLDVLEHFNKKDAIPLLVAIKSALKSGGVLIIQVPNLQAPEGHLHRYNDITHEIGFIEHSLAQVLIVAGFTDFEFQGFEELVSGGVKEKAKKVIRKLYWAKVRFERSVNCNLNPILLHPVFAAIVRKQ